jgi:hypothetical protein
MLSMCIREAVGSNSAWDIGCPDCGVSDKERARTISQLQAHYLGNFQLLFKVVSYNEIEMCQ